MAGKWDSIPDANKQHFNDPAWGDDRSGGTGFQKMHQQAADRGVSIGSTHGRSNKNTPQNSDVGDDADWLNIRPDRDAFRRRYAGPQQGDIDRARGLEGGLHKAGVGAAARDQYASRSQQQMGLHDLYARSLGQDSVVAKQNLVERDNLRRALLSQSASGAYSPAAQRGAQMALGQGQAQLGSQAQAQMAQERLAAQMAYMNAVQGMRGQDIQRYGLEFGDVASQRGLAKAGEALAQGYVGQRMQGIGAQDASAQAYEQFHSQQALNYYRTQLGLDAVSAQQDSATGQAIGQGIGSLAGLLALAASDYRGKKNISEQGGNVNTKRFLDALGGSQLPGLSQAAQTLQPPDPVAQVQAAMPPPDMQELGLGGGSLDGSVVPAAASPAPTVPSIPMGAGPNTDAQEMSGSPGMSTRDKLMFGGMLANALGGVGGSIGSALGRSLSDERSKARVGDGDDALRNYLAAVEQRAPSDDRAKVAATPINVPGGGGDNMERFLDALNASTFDYKDPTMPGAAPGRQLGVMAQDVEQGGPIGRAMVNDNGPGGLKTIDVNNQRFEPTVLAALANLNKRVRDMGA